MYYNYSDLNYINHELAGVWPGWTAVKLLGKGGFGAVYEIHRNIRGNLEKAAMKVLRVPENDAEIARLHFQGVSWQNIEEYYENYVDSIQNEIRIMQRFVGNSHIVSYEDYSIRKRQRQIGWDLYIRMELLTGLLNYAQTHPFNEKMIVRMGMDIAQGLRDCHNKGIIHRDVKPDNIFVNESGNFKLGDFGVSRSKPGSREVLSFKGTLSYMAPEVYRMLSTDERSDIYSLGMVLYQSLNDNRMPFVPPKITQYEIEAAQQRRFAGETIPTPAHGSQRLKNAVLKAVDYKPEYRFQTAEDMYLELMEVYKTDYGSERRVRGSAGRGQKPPAEKQPFTMIPAAVAAGVLAMILAAAGIVVLFRNNADFIDPGQTSQIAGTTQIAGTEDSSQIAGTKDSSQIAEAEESGQTNQGIENEPDDDSEVNTEVTDTIAEASAHGTISDSWEEIIAAGEDGTYIDKYQVGDTKELDLGEEGLIKMELVAFDADELADGSGTAHMTWIAKDLLNSEHTMNSDDTVEGGWPESDMRAWLQDSILPLFPDEVRSNIKEVKKYSYYSNSYSDQGTVASSDMIWIPSHREIYGPEKFYFEDAGPEYLKVSPNDVSRIKRRAGKPAWWWLRSVYYNYGYFSSVYYNGPEQLSGYTDGNGVAVGFCI